MPLGRSQASISKSSFSPYPPLSMHNQNAKFKGSKVFATRKIRVGEEIIVTYTYGRSFKLLHQNVDEERSGWCVFKGKRFYRDMG